VRAQLDLAQRNNQLAHGEFDFDPDANGATATRFAGR